MLLKQLKLTVPPRMTRLDMTHDELTLTPTLVKVHAKIDAVVCLLLGQNTLNWSCTTKSRDVSVITMGYDRDL